MKSNNCKRILHVVSRMHRGGAETMIMNLYRHIDREKVQFDFIVHSDIPGHYDDEIIKMGGRIIKCNSLGTIGPLKYVSQLSEIIKENGPFHAVHAHTDFQTGFVALAAKKAGIKNRICHSHNTQWQAKPNILHNIMLIIFRELINIYGTDYCACGKDAAKFLFKKNRLDKVRIINNGIEIEKFLIDDTGDIRTELNIPKDTLIIGNIARFYEQKNHKFIVELAEEMVIKNINFIILLIGEGPLFNEIKEMIKCKNLEKNIRLLGVREDIPKLMNLFDIFLLPSFYEGLPVVLVEAQASGTPCVISDTITKDVDFGLSMIYYCNLSKSKDEWIDAIYKSSEPISVSVDDRLNSLKIKGYDVKDNLKKVMELYHVQ